MRDGIITLVLVAFATTGCYRVTVETGAPPAPTQIDIPWQMSYAAGLIPPAEVDTSEQCPQGVAQVQTQRSFVNALATAVTSNIFSPLHVTVVCAGGPVGTGEASPETEEASPETEEASPETKGASPEPGEASPEPGEASPEPGDVSEVGSEKPDRSGSGDDPAPEG